MLERNFYLNNNLVEPPDNMEGIAIKFSFDKDAITESGRPANLTSISDTEWVRDNIALIKQHYDQGRIFEGYPFRFELDRGNSNKEIVFDGYLDFVNGAKFDWQERVVLTAREKQRIDWLNDRAAGITFDELYELGKITDNDFIDIPYVISTLPNYREAITMSLSIVVLTVQLTDQIIALTEDQTPIEGANPFEYSFIIKLVARVLYIISLIIIIASLIRDLFSLIIQPVKYHKGMRVVDLMRIGAEHLGYTLRAEQLQTAPLNDWVILPEKYYNPSMAEDSRLFGFQNPDTSQKGFPREDYGTFMRTWKAKLRSKLVITSNNELIFIREDKTTGTPQFQMPPLDYYQPEFEINAEEVKANYVLNFKVDFNDKNTVQQYLGTRYQVITYQTGMVPAGMDLLKNIEQYNSPYALAKTKRELTLPEEILSDFIDIFGPILINPLIKLVNIVIEGIRIIIKVIKFILKVLKTISFGKINLTIKTDGPKKLDPITTDQITNRLGMLLLENDMVQVPKLFMLKQGNSPRFNKIHPDNDTIVSAKYLWENNHRPVVSFVPNPDRPNGNQFVIKDFKQIPFTYDDYQKIKENNHIFMPDGGEGVIVEGEWDFNDETAKMKVRVSTLNSDKLAEKYIEPNGQ